MESLCINNGAIFCQIFTPKPLDKQHEILYLIAREQVNDLLL
jgi:hypothetical protein